MVAGNYTVNGRVDIFVVFTDNSPQIRIGGKTTQLPRLYL